METTRQKFWEAADLLSTGVGPLQIRLQIAADHLRGVDAEKIPEHLRAEFDKILTLSETEAAKLSRDEAEALASSIFSIYTEVHEGM